MQPTIWPIMSICLCGTTASIPPYHSPTSWTSFLKVSIRGSQRDFMIDVYDFFVCIGVFNHLLLMLMMPGGGLIYFKIKCSRIEMVSWFPYHGVYDNRYRDQPYSGSNSSESQFSLAQQLIAVHSTWLLRTRSASFPSILLHICFLGCSDHSGQGIHYYRCDCHNEEFSVREKISSLED